MEPQKGWEGRRPPPFGGRLKAAPILCSVVAYATVSENPGSILKNAIFIMTILYFMENAMFKEKCYLFF